MLGLKLREEFAGKRLKGTAIDLLDAQKKAATEFLGITYPTRDVLMLLEAAGPDHGKPVVLKGERGQGKSHLLAALFHALKDMKAAQQWLKHWADVTGDAKLASMPLRQNMHVISESLHRQQNKFLWDLLLNNHPHGVYCRGKWDALGEKKTDMPSETLLLEMFKHTPTALILDEFQTWFDGLSESDSKPFRTRAFNFIQLLSEIAKSHPDLLLLVVSVRNSSTDAFQQIQRVAPTIVDFKGPSAKRDRLRLLLHRLFENRAQIQPAQIENAVKVHLTETIRLLNVAATEHAKIRTDMVEAWPFSPHLMQLLEDQVLIATSAQETRDLIRILADLFKRGSSSSILTAGDFRLDDEASGVVALIDSVSNQHHQKLRDKALRNLQEVRAAVPSHATQLPHLDSLMGALWLRSLADVNQAGADRATLQVDVSREKAVDDNFFEGEIQTIAENSFSIHRLGDRFIFREEDNPGAKLMASARNDKLFNVGEYAGLDVEHLAKEIRYSLAGTSGAANAFHVIVLPERWRKNPWEQVPENDVPSRWDERIPLLVLPEAPANINAQLGEWLRDNLQINRNVVRFLVPKEGAPNIFADRDLLVLARCVVLSEKWKAGTLEYGQLGREYQRKLRDAFKGRFDRYAIIKNWNYQEPKNSCFTVEGHKADGDKIPPAIDRSIIENLFAFEDFEELVLKRAEISESIGKFFRELREPAPGGKDSLPWIGETQLKEHIASICADGKISIDLRGQELLQLKPGEKPELCRTRVAGKLGSGAHLDQTLLLPPQHAPSASTAKKPQSNQTLFPPTVETPVSPVQQPGTIFQQPSSTTHLEAAPNSAVNLLGRLEPWSVNPGTQLQNVRVKIEKMTGAQLDRLLKDLPDGLTYGLELEREDQ